MTATKHVAIALRLGSRPEGVTSPQLQEETGMSRRGAEQLLRRLEQLGHLTASDKPQRKGRKRGDWAITWRLVIG